MNKILYISNMYPSKDNKTYGIFIKENVELLRSKGQNITVCAITSPGGNLVFKIKKYIDFFISIIKKFFLNKYDVVHIHYFFPTILFAIPFFLKKNKIVVTFHGGDWDNKIKNSRTKLLITKIIFKKVYKIIVVSKYLETEISTAFPEFSSKVTINDMGINFSNFPKQNLNYKDNKNVCLIGNFIKEKGIEEFINAAADESLKNFDFTIVSGKLDKVFFNDMTALINEKKIKNLSIKTQLSKFEINDLLSKSFCKVIASYNEGFGIVALEAMRTKTPLLYTEVGGLKELCKNIGIPINSNSSSIVEGIKSLNTMTKHEVSHNLEFGYKKTINYDMNNKTDVLIRIYEGSSL